MTGEENYARHKILLNLRAQLEDVYKRIECELTGQ